MKFVEEVIVKEILPAVRSMITSELHQQFGLNQKEVAHHLELTQPAVSQYLNNKRADQDLINSLKEDPQIEILVNEAAGKAARKEEYADEISSIIETIRSKGLAKEKFSDTKKL